MIVIADTVFGPPVLWASEKIFISANRMGALKLQLQAKIKLVVLLNDSIILRRGGKDQIKLSNDNSIL